MLDQKILKIAKTCRQVVETFARETKIGDYNTLECYCAIASATLFSSLQHSGFFPLFVMGSYVEEDRINHCWIEVDKKIIDLTETQFFAKKKIGIHSIKNRRYTYRHAIMQGKLDKRIFDKWPKRQWPFDYYESLTEKVLEKI